jgi:hypothetical protein
MPSHINLSTPDGELLFVWSDLYKWWQSPQSLLDWQGYQCENSLPHLTGECVLLTIDPGITEHATPEDLPSRNQVVALDWFWRNQTFLHDALLEELLPYYQPIAENYAADEVLRRLTPVVQDVDDFSTLIDLSYVRFFPFTKNSLPYIGFEFECNWDPEHGLGILLNGLRLVDIGGSDVVKQDYNIIIDGGYI